MAKLSAKPAPKKPSAPKKPTSRSKTGNSACSEAASNWQLSLRGKAALSPDTYQTLAKCRALSSTKKRADAYGRTGKLSDMGAAALSARADKRFSQGLVTQKSRTDRLNVLLKQRSERGNAVVGKGITVNKADFERRIGGPAKPQAEEPPKPKSSMAEGRTNRALDKTMGFNGIVMTRRKAIEDRVNAGAKIALSPKGTRRLMNPDGSFLDESQISKTAMDYAERLATTKDAVKKTAENTGTYGDYYFTPDGQYVKMSGSGGMGSNRVGAYDIRGRKVGMYNRDELRFANAAQRQTKESEKASEQLSDIAARVTKVRSENEKILLGKDITDRFRKSLEKGEIDQSKFDDLKKRGFILSDKEYGDAIAAQKRIDEIRNELTTPTPPKPAEPARYSLGGKLAPGRGTEERKARAKYKLSVRKGDLQGIADGANMMAKAKGFKPSWKVETDKTGHSFVRGGVVQWNLGVLQDKQRIQTRSKLAR